MAYQTYITDALVCGSKNSNTSDKAYLLFTREAGMVWASARSVREERSKQRFALQEFSLLRATLVRGKGGWRIAGVEPIRNIFFEADDRTMRGAIRNIMRLLRRTMHGEIPHQKLFDDITASFSLKQEDAKDFELVYSLRVLYALGYVSPEKEYESYLAPEYSIVAPLDEGTRIHMKKAIDTAILSSHL